MNPRPCKQCNQDVGTKRKTFCSKSCYTKYQSLNPNPGTFKIGRKQTVAQRKALATIPRLSTEERFFRKARIDINGCWNWIASIKPGGYGNFGIKKNGQQQTFNAHRWSYAYLKGEIPTNLTIDHLCRNPRCVNPDHMELVTMRENLLRGNGFPAQNARKTHCDNGHELVSYPYNGSAKRYCPICTSIRMKNYRVLNHEWYLKVKRDSYHRVKERNKLKEKSIEPVEV